MIRMNFQDQFFIQDLIEDWLCAGIPDVQPPEGILYDDALFVDFWSAATRIGSEPMRQAPPPADEFQYDKFKARVRR